MMRKGGTIFNCRSVFNDVYMREDSPPLLSRLMSIITISQVQITAVLIHIYPLQMNYQNIKSFTVSVTKCEKVHLTWQLFDELVD